MKEISAQELKARIDRGDRFRPVMARGELAFQGKHIPGSVNLHDAEPLLAELDSEGETVVYYSDRLCPANMMAYQLLESRGYQHVWRFSGGLTEWERAGFPLEGKLV